MLDTLRGQLIPTAFADAPDASVMVGGVTAQTVDFNASLASHTPLVFAFVLVAAFLLLLVTFRSLVIAIKAIVLNLLSVGASYGVLVLVFQNGLGEKLLGFHSNGAIVAWLPLFLFVVLFGLSMDYHVFILSRVREAYDTGMSTDRAVAHAIGTTAGVVTSAAAVMVAVFALFGTLSNISLKEMGVGLAVAVFLDATIVRGMLLPASMKLLGDWNWWLPRKLHWLPQLSVEGEVAAPAERLNHPTTPDTGTRHCGGYRRLRVRSKGACPMSDRAFGGRLHPCSRQRLPASRPSQPDSPSPPERPARSAPPPARPRRFRTVSRSPPPTPASATT